MTRKAVILGCGRVGATIARDLASDDAYEVTVADACIENLRALEALAKVTTIRVDLGDPIKLRTAIEPSDVVLGALPSALGLAALKTVIETRKPYCDISFMDADPMTLDALAKQHGVMAVVDCGVSPGLSNMVIGYAHARLERALRATIYVGGLPKARRWPYQYKAPFAPADVIEEYTRPARLKEHGQVVVRPALSDPELIDFGRLGTLEATNTDGLRTLLTTVDVPHMKEKTLRYPGHFELMRVLRETGYFSKDEVEVNGSKVRPLDLTSKLLFRQWAFEPGEEDFTVMRVIVEGVGEDAMIRYTYDLYDEYDSARGVSSMARTTGFPCVIVARMLAEGRLSEPGVFPPERIARVDGVFEHMVAQLKARGVTLTETVERDPA